MSLLSRGSRQPSGKSGRDRSNQQRRINLNADESGSTQSGCLLGIQKNWQTNPGAVGRWFKQQLDPDIWSEIEATLAGADFEENWNAMFKIMEVFRRLTSEVGTHLGYTYPTDVDRDVTAHVTEVRRVDTTSDSSR